MRIWIDYSRRLILAAAFFPALSQGQTVTGHLALTGDSTAWTPPPAAPWNQTYYWSTCDEATHDCTNSYTLQLKVWPVYSQTSVDQGSQYSNFFLMELTTSLNVNDCWGFYTGNHAGRIAAYWLRQFNVSARIIPPDGRGPWTNADLQTDLSAYNPKTANASTTIDQGVTWSLSGTGTVGAGTNKGVGFTAGVSFNNSHTTSYDALAISTDIAPADDPSAMAWTYDAWDYVHEVIEPGNRACGGPGLQPLPAILTSTATTVQTWIYEASSDVREAYADTGTLPVAFDFSVLLGYTFYANTLGNCTGNPKTRTPIGSFPLHNLANAHTVGDLNAPASQGLAFDVSCGTTTQYGTIPLGSGSDPDWGPGNPGQPLPMNTWIVQIPFAPTHVPDND